MMTPHWIQSPREVMVDWQRPVLPAPLFRRVFRVNTVPHHALLRLCGLGFYELSLNGSKVSDHVLDPIPTIYDRRARFVRHDVTALLQKGDNAIAVILGNGWYNSHTPDVWHFDKATWRDYPTLWLDLEIVDSHGAVTRVVSDTQWRVGEGPIRFDALRNGEIYDARQEQNGWDTSDFDDAAWPRARIASGPGGLLEEQTSPPCKIMETIVPVSVREIKPGVALFDMGQNIAGWAQLRMAGEAGQTVTLRYGERLHEDGTLDQRAIGACIKGGDIQTDRYICKGKGEEIWEPRFTYHGFQYVQVEGLNHPATLAMLRGRVVHTAFDSSGTFDCSNEDLNRLQACTRRAYLSNFVGIPTDCPHREKNGWTGDAQLAAETGFMNVDAATSYEQWMYTLMDTQRPNGQLPGIAPTSGWGYNWGSGPAWDAALILIPGYIHLYTGSDRAIRAGYDAMRRYMDYCAQMEEDGLLTFGLGDWCPPRKDTVTPASLTSTAYYYVFARRLAEYARLIGRPGDADAYQALGMRVRDSFHRAFYKGDGLYADGQPTAQACALYQNLVDAKDQPRVAHRLVEALDNANGVADFGILGAKYVPRALAEHGYAQRAYALLTQPSFPGWVHWLRQGATTLWEEWDGKGSRNHVMFGDISAWMYHYLAGIQPDPDAPGFRHIRLRPFFAKGLDYVRASHRCPYGIIHSSWQRKGNYVVLDVTVPPGSSATLCAEAIPEQTLSSGAYQFISEYHENV